MSDIRPSPLVPQDVDLRDFAGMWLDVGRVLKSETWRLGTSDEKAAAITLWMESWHEVPAGSLPNNDRLLSKLSQSERWPKSKAHALRNWVECSDGRLYHPIVATKALEAWIEKLTAAINGAVGNAKRWQVAVDTAMLRDQLRTAVDALRSLDPASRTLKKKPVVVLLAPSPPESPPESPPDRKGPDQIRPDISPTETSSPTESTARKRARQPAALDADTLAAQGVDRQHAIDWLAVRKAKDLPLTRTAWDQTVAEAGKAGITPAEAVRMSAANGWAGFRASWLARQDDPKPNGAHAAVVRPLNRQLAIEAENRRVAAEWLAQEAASDGAAATQPDTEARIGTA